VWRCPEESLTERRSKAERRREELLHIIYQDDVTSSEHVQQGNVKFLGNGGVVSPASQPASHLLFFNRGWGKSKVLVQLAYGLRVAQSAILATPGYNGYS